MNYVVFPGGGAYIARTVRYIADLGQQTVTEVPLSNSPLAA